MAALENDWSLYIIQCSDYSLYTGISRQADKRFQQHAQGQGAKYFRGRRPLRIVYLEVGYSRSLASRREAAIKAMKREDKLAMIADFQKQLARKERDNQVELVTANRLSPT